MVRKDKAPELIWQSKRSKFYIIGVEDGVRYERSTKTQDKDIANKVFADFLYNFGPKSGAKDPELVLITDVLTDYFADRKQQEKSTIRIGYAMNPLIDFWKGKMITDITRQRCSEYNAGRIKANGKPIADGTLIKELGTLRAAINHAKDERRIKYGVNVYTPDTPDAKTRWLTKTEAANLLRGARAVYKARTYLPLFILIGLHTGARRGAILSLKWDQIDLDRKILDWNPAGRKRSNKKRPIIKIPRKLHNHLKRARRLSNANGYVININGEGILDPKKSFASARTNASLDNKVTPHTMRHTRATWGMQSGANKWELAGFLGMSLETLERVYGHHHPDFQCAAADTY